MACSLLYSYKLTYFVENCKQNRSTKFDTRGPSKRRHTYIYNKIALIDIFISPYTF
nr:MAG TPA: hypothetical protein [Caudoviricetes sp.]